MTTDAILAELRTLPGAPESLRERVRALPEPQPRFTWSWPRIDIRRTLLVAAPAAVALAVGAAALHGVLEGGGSQNPQPLALRAEVHDAQRSAGGGAATGTTPVFGAHTVRALRNQDYLKRLATPQLGATALPPSTTRLNKYNAWLTVRVDHDRLAKATTRAMQIARGYGGYVASVDMNTPGKRGTASLVLRVPVTKVEDAVLRLGKLGDVTAQRVRIQDLQRQANVQQREILKLRTTIASLKQRLAGPLSAEERLRLQYQLAEARQSLAQTTKAHAGTVREGTLATVSLTFSTPQAAAVVPHHRGRFDRMMRDAGSFLVSELAWLLYALIVAGPIAILAAVGVVVARSARRRGEARLLESS
jgi:hypothetical protein